MQGLAANVLKQTLGEKEAAARLMELRNQNVYQSGMLKVALGQLGLSKETEDFRKKIERYKAEVAAQRPPQGKIEEDLVNSAARVNWAKQMKAPKGLVKLLEEDHKAKQKAVEELGYRTGGVPQWPDEAPAPAVVPPGAGVSPAVPVAPGVGGGNVSVTNAPPVDDVVRVQIPGHPPGAIHRSQLPAFKAKYPNAVVAP